MGNNKFVVPLVIQTRGVMSPCAQALNILFGKSLCSFRTCDKKAWNFANFRSPRCSCVDVTA